MTVTAKALVAALLLVSLAGISVSIQTHPAAAATQGNAIVSAAASQAGVPYCDSGGGINGPSYGGVNEPGCPTGTKGFDCMSLAIYAVYQGTGIALPANGLGGGTFIPPSDTADLLPGDIVYWGGGSLGTYVHSGVYVDSGHVWDALGVNQPVQTHTMAQLETEYHNVYDGAVRYWTVGPPPTITSISPTSGPVGTVVIIMGTNLNGATKVAFNGVKGTITKDVATKIKVKVPVGATTSQIKVATPGGKVKTATFTVT